MKGYGVMHSGTVGGFPSWVGTTIKEAKKYLLAASKEHSTVHLYKYSTKLNAWNHVETFKSEEDIRDYKARG